LIRRNERLICSSPLVLCSPISMITVLLPPLTPLPLLHGHLGTPCSVTRGNSPDPRALWARDLQRVSSSDQRYGELGSRRLGAAPLPLAGAQQLWEARISDLPSSGLESMGDYKPVGPLWFHCFPKVTALSWKWWCQKRQFPFSDDSTREVRDIFKDCSNSTMTSWRPTIF
jgi:hypothetical protein